MIFIQKLPALEPEMRCALKSHIIRKRQRLKQELEQDAIEKRLKKEKELKRVQDAMTLDQIKEQLTVLEKRLESLKNEKHSLFVQLKQVISEGNSANKRKQDELEAQKKQKTDQSNISGSSGGGATNQTSNSTTTSNCKPHTASNSNDSKPINKQSANISGQLSTHELFNNHLKHYPSSRPSIPSSHHSAPPPLPLTSSIYNQRIPHHPRYQSFPDDANPLLGSTMLSNARSASAFSAEVSSYSRHSSPSISTTSSDSRAQNLSAVQANYRNHHHSIEPPLGAPHDHLPPLSTHSALDPNQQRLAHLNSRLQQPGLLMDIPMSLASLHSHDPKLLPHGFAGKLPLSVANANVSLPDDRSLGHRKKHNSFGLYPTSAAAPSPLQQLFPDGLPPHLSSHFLNTHQQSPSTALSNSTNLIDLMPTSSSSSWNMAMHGSNFYPSKSQPQLQQSTSAALQLHHQALASGSPNFDFLSSQSKSNLLVPGFHPFFPHPQMHPQAGTAAPLITPTSICSTSVDQSDLKHLSPLYNSSLAQRYANVAQFSSLQQLSQQEQIRLFAAANASNYQRKTSPKHPPFHSNNK